MADQTKFLLSEDELPPAWYNLKADLPFELPPVLHPVRKSPLGPEDLAPLFPRAIISQEVTRERWVEIPEPVREIFELPQSEIDRAVRELPGVEPGAGG